MAPSSQVFERCERLELVQAAIYDALAEGFRGDAATSAIFARLAEEERQHAHRVKLFAGRYRHDRSLGAGVDVDLPTLDRLLREAEAVREAVRTGAWGRDLGVVRQHLLVMEERFAAAHAELLAASSPALRPFFEQLAAQDRAHAALLAR